MLFQSDIFRKATEDQGSKMKKILYISFLNESERPGYMKKIHSQAKAFGRLVDESYLLIMNGHGFKLYSFREGKETELKKFQAKGRRIKEERNVIDEMFLFKLFCKIVKEICLKWKIDCVYVRRVVPITPFLLELLRKLKEDGVKIIYEYPTYPWKDEMRKNTQSIPRKIFYFLDCFYYKSLIKIPDIITYIGFYGGADKRFFAIQNCGSEEDFRLKRKWRKTDGKELNLIGVGHLRYEHGYDLLLKALKEYYESPHCFRTVRFNIVGTVDPNLQLEKYVKDNGLTDYVHFSGFLEGEDLDRAFENADIGVNTLRTEKEVSYEKGCTTLKTVEYTYRGIPQISGAGFMIDGAEKADAPFFLYVIPKSNFSIQQILDFYDGLDSAFTPAVAREYAKEHMSWECSFKKIINRMEKTENVRA